MAKKSVWKDKVCKFCGITFRKRIQIGKESKRHYCSNTCRKADPDSFKSEWTEERKKQLSKRMNGSKNPNFGNKWTNKQRNALSLKAQKRYIESPELRYICGKSNRGKKFSKERIEAMHGHRKRESYVHYHSEETKKKIGQKSKEKFTEEFKERQRKVMEEKGYWTPLDQVDPYKIYFKESNWLEMMDQFFSKNEQDIFNTFGIFSKNNTKGYVRDHIVSRSLGFEFDLPKEILRHPENLQFISHRENIRKGFKDRKLSMEEKEKAVNDLLERIKNFRGSWKEQEQCLTFINNRPKV